MPTTTIFILSGSTWSVPSNWKNTGNTVECIGGGGGGSSRAAGGGAGGGGGAYARSTNIVLTPSSSINVGVGSGGSDSAGGDTWFNATSAANAATLGASVAVAAVGAPYTSATSSSQSGGSAASSTGTVKYGGGQSGAGSNTVGRTGGGGGAGGPNGAGVGGMPGATSSPSGAGGDGGAGFGGIGGASQTTSGNPGLPGGNGTEWDATHGSGGGGSGARSSVQGGGAGGNYGGGGGGRISSSSASVGGPGIIVVTYPSSTDYSIAAAGGTVSLSGKNTSFRRVPRPISIGAGAFAVVGKDASLRRVSTPVSVSIATGSIAVGGKSAQLAAHRSFLLHASSGGVSGGAAALTSGVVGNYGGSIFGYSDGEIWPEFGTIVQDDGTPIVRIVVWSSSLDDELTVLTHYFPDGAYSPGSYPPIPAKVNGQDVTLVDAAFDQGLEGYYAVIADWPGVLPTDGSAWTFEFGEDTELTPALAVIGNALSLRRFRDTLLQATKGEFELASPAVDLLVEVQAEQFTLQPAPMSNVVSPGDTNLNRTAHLRSGSGAASLSGVIIGMRLATYLRGAVGVLETAGQAITRHLTRRAVAEAGSLGQGMSSAGLYARYLHRSAPGGVNINGAGATFHRGFRFLLSNGALTVAGTAGSFSRTAIAALASGWVPVNGVPGLFSNLTVKRLSAAAGAISMVGNSTLSTVVRKCRTAVGSMVVAGNSVAHHVSRSLRGAGAGIAITGAAGRLAPIFSMVSAAGSVGLSGQVALYKISRVVRSAAGQIQTVGDSAALRVARTVLASGWDMTLGGAETVSRIGRRMAVGANVLALQGQAVTLKNQLAGIVLEAGSGGTLVSGQVARLLAVLTRSSAEGAITIAGGAAAGRLTMVLGTDPGSFQLIGNVPSLRSDLRLKAWAGGFASVGVDVRLRSLAAIHPDAGMIVVTGTAAGLSAQTRISPSDSGLIVHGQGLFVSLRRGSSRGAIVTAGRPVGLVRKAIARAASLPLAVNGRPAKLTSGRSMEVSSGDLRIVGFEASAAALHALRSATGVLDFEGHVVEFVTDAGVKSVFVNIGGQWILPRSIYARLGGVWRPVSSIFVNRGGDWSPLR